MEKMTAMNDQYSPADDHAGQVRNGSAGGAVSPVIRDMREEDLERIEQIEVRNFSRPWTVQDFRDFLLRDDAIFLTALCDGEIAGYIGFYGIPDEGDITNVSVDERFRRRGIGRALVSELISRAAAHGIGTIFLEVRDSNEAAIRLYEAEGFGQVGLRRRYYSSPVEDARIMRYPAPAAEYSAD